MTLIRQRLRLTADEQVFQMVLELAAGEGLIDGKTIGVDATLLEANAAMKTIVRKGRREDCAPSSRGSRRSRASRSRATRTCAVSTKRARTRRRATRSGSRRATPTAGSRG
jgi:hypothetical protein